MKVPYIIAISLTFVFFDNCFSQERIEFPDVKQPLYIAVNNQGVFVTEETSFSFFSPVGFNRTYRFEKDRDGANLFKYPPILCLYSDFIFINSFTLCAWVSYNGDDLRIKEYTDFKDFQSHTELMLFPLKGKFLKRIVDHENKRQKVYLLDAEFNEIKKITEAYYDFTKIPDDIKDFKLLYHYTGIEVSDDKIYVGDTHKGFHIQVFDLEGELLYTIDKEFENQDVSSEFKDKALEEMKANAGYYNYLSRQNVEFSFYEKFPAFRYFQVVDNRIYVYTYKSTNNRHEIMILDLRGDLIKTVYLPLRSMQTLKFPGSYDLLTVHANKMYELIENTDTKIWELYITAIE